VADKHGPSVLDHEVYSAPADPESAFEDQGRLTAIQARMRRAIGAGVRAGALLLD